MSAYTKLSTKKIRLKILVLKNINSAFFYPFCIFLKDFIQGGQYMYEIFKFVRIVLDNTYLNQLFMTDSPGLLHRKTTFDKNNFSQRRFSDYPTSPFSYQQSDGRSNYPSMQPQLQERKIFGFEIYIDNDILSEFGVIQDWFKQVSSSQKIQYIRFNSQLTIPDLKGRNIQIYDVDMQKKYQCAKAMLYDIYQVFKRIKREAFSIIIFVPEGMVSLLIGAKGHQINKIMKESHTTIVINQPINRMTYRTAKIQGYHSDVAKACRIIYEMLEQKSSIAYSIQKQPSQLDYTQSKIKSKFIFPDDLLSYLEKRKKRLLIKIQQETKCSLKFESSRENRLLKKQEVSCIMTGKLEDVQAMVVMMINISHQFLSEDKHNIDYTLRMLIPANYVTKLIGQKGYMIRDIIERSGGAQIKILSDKQEKDRECIISINGSKQNKIDAACFIIQQIECFKNGGPILQSGKSINQNLAQQFKNTLPLPVREDEIKPQVVQQKPKETIVENVSQQQGLVQEEQKVNENKVEPEKKESADLTRKIITPLKSSNEISRKSESRSDSNSRSRSRDKQKKKSKKLQYNRKQKSESESVEYKHDRQQLQVKMIIPKRLGHDHKQLSYIESLCKSSVKVLNQKLQGDEVVISIRGGMKDNSRCIELLQKRLLRYKTSLASSVG